MSKNPVSAPTCLKMLRSLSILLLAGAALVPSASAQEGLPTSEAQAFLGYWLLSAELGGRDVKMGLEIDERGTFTTARIVAFFGELEGEQLRKDGDKLLFDVTTDFGPFVVDLLIRDGGLVGGMEQNGQRVAEFTGVGSDAATLARFMIPENETRIERDGKLVRVRFARPKTGGLDYQRVETLEPGQVATFLEFPAIKLTTELPLELRGTQVPTENVAKDYPGVYGVWIQRLEDGWQLVLNAQGDVWGTQFDSEVENLTAALDYERAEESTERLQAAFEETESGNRLVVQWGEHRWSTPVEIATPADGAAE